MGQDNLKTIVVGLGLFTLFTWLILSVAIDFGNEYGRSSEEIGDGSLNIVDFQNSANSISGNTSSYRQAFESGNVDDIDDASGMFSTARKLINLITTPFTLLGQILQNIFNMATEVINVILGILSILIILAIWSLLRKGD